MFGFRSLAFGVVSDHALVSFLFQRTHKKKKLKNSEKPIDEDLADSTGLMEKLRKLCLCGRCTGIRPVRFCSWICLLQTCVRHADTGTTAKTHDVGEPVFFHQPLEARNTQTTVTLDCEWSVGTKRKRKKKRARRKLPIHGLECLILAWPGTTVER